jgi:superfamily II DNA/RNA helicase
MPPEIQRIADTFLHNPVRVEVSKPATAASTITQILVAASSEPHEKRESLRGLIRSAENFKNAIIFCNRKSEVAQLHRSLARHKFSAVALHGDMDQQARNAALDAFRKGEVDLLVASDVAARGLDIPEVSHIFNFDVPHHPDDYVHRIGRTGRAGCTGTAITIVAPSDRKAISTIEQLIGQSIPWSGEPAAMEDRKTRHGSGGRAQAGRPQRTRSAPGSGHELRRQFQAPQPQLRASKGFTDTPAPRPPHDHDDEPALSHLPAFLLRPVPVKV